MVFNLVFANNTISSSFFSFSFSLMIDFYFLTPEVIAKNFNPNAELAMPIGIPTKEAKVKIETRPVTVEAKISKYSILFKAVQTFLRFLPISSFWLFLQ